MDKFWESIWRALSEDWHVIQQNWKIFSAFQIVVIAATWAILSWHFSGVMDDQSGQIQDLQTQNQMLQQQISDNLKPNTISTAQSAPKRTLTDEQRTCLINQLKDKTSEYTAIAVYYFAPDSDAQQYATDFENLLMRVGIDSGIGPVPLDDYSDTGLMIGVTDVNKPTNSAVDLKDILAACGISVRFVKYSPGINLLPQFAPIPFDLFVGPQN